MPTLPKEVLREMIKKENLKSAGGIYFILEIGSF